jgi:hypothetical protein
MAFLDWVDTAWRLSTTLVLGMIGSWLLYVGFYVKTVLARRLRFCPPQGILTRIIVNPKDLAQVRRVIRTAV